MELIRDFHNLRAKHRACAATIGNFDGVHIGHQRILEQVREAGQRLNLPVAVITFEPQPREYFQGEAAPARLMRLREKYLWLSRYGVDRMVCFRFNEALANLEPAAFIDRLLVEGLGVQALVIGDDFRFGRDRAGGFDLLEFYSSQNSIDLIRAETVSLGGERISSTRVRAALGQGDLEAARALLGRHYSMSGRVAHGQKRGRTIGFPTININLHRHGVVLKGIFAARVHGLGKEPRASVAYIGNRPIVNGVQHVLEAHIFDYDGDCYGQQLQVDFIAKIRDDMDFKDFEALRRQIELDAAAARELLNTEEPA